VGQRAPTAAIAPDYEKWNKVLSGFFFPAEASHQPVYLQVDKDSLGELGPPAGVAPEQAEASFVRAVRSKVSVGGANPFVKFLWMDSWRKRVRVDPAAPPPFVGLLGLCVFAASKMANDPGAGITGANYYARLNELLGLDHRGMPPSFEKVTALWGELARWLVEDNDGRLGLPTAVPHRAFRHVGFPISQCLLRDSDRKKLPGFFRWEGFAPGQDVGPGDLAPRLKEWVSSGRCTLSRQARKVLTGSEDLVQQAAATVAGELKSWDGALGVDAEGRRQARIEVHVETYRGGRRFGCELYPRAPEGFPDGEYRNGSTSVRLERIKGTAWFGFLPAALVAKALGNGLNLRTDRFALCFSGSRVIPLEKSAELGGWISCQRLVSGEEHMILCHASFSGRVEQYLRQSAEEGWALAPATSGLPPSWVCFRGVRIEDIPSGRISEGLDCLVPVWRAGISFSGGLKIGHDAWLAGGEPRVTVTSEKNLAVHVLIDGEAAGSLASGSLTLDLASLGLAPGEHEVSAGPQRRRFRLSRSGYGREPDVAGRHLGHVLGRDGEVFLPAALGAGEVPEAGKEPEGTLSVVGASVSGAPGNVPDPIREALRLPRAYKRYAILGSRPGEVVEYEPDAEAPYWFLREMGALDGYFRLPIAFEPQWIVAVGANRKEYLWPTGSARSPGAPTASGDVARWVWWARKSYRNLKGKQKRAAWDEYRAAAARLGVGK
jgi:hypothetical protein